MKLENWSVRIGNSDPYTAPECAPRRISGEVYGHPVFDDGEVITTSDIVEVKGRKVTTHNSVYKLGAPAPAFVEWCKANGCHVPTKEEPIK